MLQRTLSEIAKDIVKEYRYYKCCNDEEDFIFCREMLESLLEELDDLYKNSL